MKMDCKSERRANVDVKSHIKHFPIIKIVPVGTDTQRGAPAIKTPASSVPAGNPGLPVVGPPPTINKQNIIIVKTKRV